MSRSRSNKRGAGLHALGIIQEERPAAATSKENREIPDRLETLDAVTAGLVSDTEALAQILEPILVTHPTATKKAQGEEERMSTTAVGGRIGTAIDTVAAVRLRLQDLLGRAAL